MKIIKKAAIAVFGAASLIMPLGLGAVAHAQSVPPGTLNCVAIEFNEDAGPFCDLSLKKEVSVNGGAFVDANNSSDAASAHVGDQVVWRITVSNSGSSTPTGLGSVTVNDVLPSGVTYVSSASSDGSTYYTSLNQWIIPLASIISTSSVSLDITTQANAVGSSENIATIAFHDPGSCDGNRCVYGDDNSANDTDNAWISVSAQPQVLADTTTLAKTGNGAAPSLIAGGLIVATLTVGFFGRGRQSKLDS